MELSKKFQEASSFRTIKINSMEVDRKYRIVYAEQVVTKFGQSVLLSITHPSI